MVYFQKKKKLTRNKSHYQHVKLTMELEESQGDVKLNLRVYLYCYVASISCSNTGSMNEEAKEMKLRNKPIAIFFPGSLVFASFFGETM